MRRQKPKAAAKRAMGKAEKVRVNTSEVRGPEEFQVLMKELIRQMNGPIGSPSSSRQDRASLGRRVQWPHTDSLPQQARHGCNPDRRRPRRG